MTRLLLDTTFLVEAERDSVELAQAIEDDADVAVAAITMAELLVGVHLASSPHRRTRLTFVEQIAAAVPVLDYGLMVAREHGRLLAHVRKSGRPRGAHDLIIAATAAAHQRTVVTADAAGFSDLPGVTTRPH